MKLGGELSCKHFRAFTPVARQAGESELTRGSGQRARACSRDFDLCGYAVPVKLNVRLMSSARRVRFGGLPSLTLSVCPTICQARGADDSLAGARPTRNRSPDVAVIVRVQAVPWGLTAQMSSVAGELMVVAGGDHKHGRRVCLGKLVCNGERQLLCFQALTHPIFWIIPLYQINRIFPVFSSRNGVKIPYYAYVSKCPGSAQRHLNQC